MNIGDSLLLLMRDATVQSYIISLGASMSWDAIKGLKKVKEKDSWELQFYCVICETFQKFYDKYNLEYQENLIVESFIEVCSNVNISDYRYSFKEIICATIGLELSDTEFVDWLEIFCNVCSNPKYEWVYNKILLNNELKAQIVAKKDKKFVLIHIAACLNRYLSIESDIFWGENMMWYEDIIAILNDKFSISWKDRLILLLRNVKNADDEFVDKMDYITSSQSCETVLQSAKELLESYEWEKDDKIHLHEIIKSNKFSKIFIVTGTEGSGKTYFIRKYLRYAQELIKSGELRIVPVIISVSDLETISGLFLDMCSEILCINIYNVDECVEILKSYHLQICFIIDDLQIACIKNAQLFSQLIEQIKEFSRYDEFRWILTVSEYDYYLLNQERQFINNYAISRDELMNNRVQLDLIFNNVFSLTKYNVDNGVSEIIIDKLYNVQVHNIEEAFCSIEKTDCIIDTPLMAHLFGQCVQNEQVVELPNTYINYIQKVVDWKNDILSESPRCLTLQNDIIKILSICFELKNIEIPHEKLSKDINERNIDELRINQLVSYIETKEKNIFNANFVTRTYRLQNQIFWAAKIVGFIRGEKKLCAEELKKFPTNLLPWLVSFYILLIKNIEDDEYQKLFDDLFHNELGSYALFCAQKAGAQYSKKMFEYLRDHIMLVSDIKTCYAVLYFIYFSQLKIAEKFMLFSLMETKVAEFQLEDMYDMFFRAVLSCSSKLKKFKKNMLILAEGSVKRINIINGYRCSEKYCDLLSEESRDFQSSLREFVYNIYKHPEIKKQIDISNGKNASFMDYFIRGCFEYQISRRPDLIKYYDEFIPLFEEETIVGSFLRRNFTCAAGNYFSKHGKYTFYRSEYIDLVKSLSQRREKKYKETALLLIVNSRQDEARVDKDLLSILEQILCDPWIRKKFGKKSYVKFWIDNN